jgi:hypothetical protein
LKPHIAKLYGGPLDGLEVEVFECSPDAAYIDFPRDAPNGPGIFTSYAGGEEHDTDPSPFAARYWFATRPSSGGKLPRRCVLIWDGMK